MIEYLFIGLITLAIPFFISPRRTRKAEHDATVQVSRRSSADLAATKDSHDKASKIREFAKSQGNNISVIPISTTIKPSPDKITATIDHNYRLYLIPSLPHFGSYRLGALNGTAIHRGCLVIFSVYHTMKPANFAGLLSDSKARRRKQKWTGAHQN
ncbi:hypothetical protein OQA88_1411 [Cercophora sp. LCS_1]